MQHQQLRTVVLNSFLRPDEKDRHKVVFYKRCGERQARSVAGLRYFTFRKNFDIAGSAGP